MKLYNIIFKLIGSPKRWTIKKVLNFLYRVSYNNDSVHVKVEILNYFCEVYAKVFIPSVFIIIFRSPRVFCEKRFCEASNCQSVSWRAIKIVVYARVCSGLGVILKKAIMQGVRYFDWFPSWASKIDVLFL